MGNVWLLAILLSLNVGLWTQRVAAGILTFLVLTMLLVFDEATGFTKEEG